MNRWENLKELDDEFVKAKRNVKKCEEEICDIFREKLEFIDCLKEISIDRRRNEIEVRLYNLQRNNSLSPQSYSVPVILTLTDMKRIEKILPGCEVTMPINEYEGCSTVKGKTLIEFLRSDVMDGDIK